MSIIWDCNKSLPILPISIIKLELTWKVVDNIIVPPHIKFLKIGDYHCVQHSAKYLVVYGHYCINPIPTSVTDLFIGTCKIIPDSVLTLSTNRFSSINYSAKYNNSADHIIIFHRNVEKIKLKILFFP